MRRMIRTSAVLVALLAVCLSVGSANARVSGITAQPVATGLNFPSGFDIAPDGRIFYVEHPTGQIRIFDPATQSNTLFHQIAFSHDPDFSLISLVLNPDYPTVPYVYVYLTHQVNLIARNQVLRYTDSGGTGMNETVIFNDPAGGNHNGGALEFGPDKMLYLIDGDHKNDANSQDLTNNFGKVLRITQKGKVPRGNPFGNDIFAYGYRNSIGLTFDPLSGRLWGTDNGPGCNDEVNRIIKGGNYGWGPNKDCHIGTSPENTNNSGPNPIFPELWYTPTIDPTGIAFCTLCGLDPASEGALFFGAFNTGDIHRAMLDTRRKHLISDQIVYTDPNLRVLHMQQGPDGAIYFSDAGGIYKLVMS
jgi:glucose/arabinose dehydrogenase